jgi:hypothetical protein
MAAKYIVALSVAPFLASGAIAQVTCPMPDGGSPEVRQAVSLVGQLPELRAWAKAHSLPVAFSPELQPLERDGRCYLALSVEASHKGRRELWHLFYVEPESRTILVLDPVSGEIIPLEQWRHAKNR